MKFPRKRKRIFGFCILLTMVALALATAVLAASGQWAGSGSYSLVIQKQFAADTPDAVLAEAKKQTYTFHIEGYRLDGNKNEIPIDQYVTIGPGSDNWTAETDGDSAIRWKQSQTFSSEGPIHVSVTEITNTNTLHVGGQEYNMGDSRAETTTLFTEAPQVRDLNSNGKIVLSRPNKIDDGNETKTVTTTSSFRIRSEWPWDSGQVAKPTDWTAFDKTVELSPGKTYEFKNLQPGRYTIEDLSVSGYNIELGERTQDVLAGQEGTFYINSKPGKLVITAGGAEGDGQTHVYRVERTYAPEGAQDFVDRYTDPVESGKTYTLENLPKGRYRVTEYTPPDVPTEFTVKVKSVQEGATKTGRLNSSEKDGVQTFKITEANKASYGKFTLNKDVVYITDLYYGPLRNEKGSALKETYTYSFGLRGRKTADPNGYAIENGYTTFSISNVPANPKKKFTSKSLTPTDRFYPRTDNSFAVSVWNMTASTGKYINLSWTEWEKTEDTFTPTKANSNYSYTVDDWGVPNSGWIEVTAPAMENGKKVSYVYTLRKTQNGPALQTLTLDSGETRKFEGLEAGTYLLTEEVEQADFRMAISGGPFGSTVAGNSFDLTVMGDRELTITKPDNSQDGDRTYTFKVERLLDNGNVDTSYEIKPVTLEAGQNSGENTSENPNGTNQSITLKKGHYRVTPTDDMTEVYELTCSDSSQVHAQVPSGSSATVTFTNVFTQGNVGYRYVHEYYRKIGDRYEYEGCSPVTTVGGRTDKTEQYSSIDVIKEPEFTVGGKTYQYDYMPENNAFGKVVDSAPGGNQAGDEGLYTWNQSAERGASGGGTTICYQRNDDLTAARKIGVDENKSQIIILRYFRVLPEDQKGHYKYVHVYYHRTADGTEEWEGTSAIQAATGQLGLTYSAPSSTVQLMPEYKPKDSEETYTYEFNGRPSYGKLTDDHTAPHIELYAVTHDSTDTNHYHYIPDSDATGVLATDDPDDSQNIIILRYYRGVVTPPGQEETKEGTYKVVHEYYYREKLEDSGAEEDTGDVSGETPEEGADPESMDPPVGDENGTTPAGLPTEDESGTTPAGLPTEDGDSTTPDDPPQPPEANAPENGGATSADGENSAPTAEGEKDDPPPAGDGDDVAPADPPAEDGDDAAPDNLPQDPEDKNGGAEDGGGESGTTEGAGDGDTPASSPEADSLVAPQNDGPSGTQPDPMPAGNDNTQPPDDGDDSAQLPDDGEPPAEPEPEEPPDSEPGGTSPDSSEAPPTEPGPSETTDAKPESSETPSEPSETPKPDDPPEVPDTSADSTDNDQTPAPGNGDPEGNGQSQAPGNDEPEGGDPSQPPENDSLKGDELPLDENAEDTPQGGDASFSGTLSSDGKYTYTFEGARKVETIKAPLGNIYYGTKDDWLLNWSPENDANTYAYKNYDVVYGISDSNGGYTYHQNMEWASSTESGEQIIILRYIRGDGVVPDTPDPPTPPTHSEHDPTYAYRVVHEYYLEDADGNRTLEGKTDVKRMVGSKGKTYNESDVTKLPKYNGKEYTYTGDAYGTWSGGQNYDAENGKTYVEATASGNQIIILCYVRKEPPKTEVSYKVIHEYYVRDLEGNETLVGTSEIRAVMEASPDLQYTQADVGREPDFQGETYTYFGDGYGTVSGQDYSEVSGQRYALATMSGDQIIILRYVREEKPEQPSQTPEDPPKDPEHPTEPPDPNDPDSPDEITIWENEIPKTYIKVWDPEKQEWVYLPEVDVPLWNEIPQPGAEIGIPGEDLLITLPQPDGGSYILAEDTSLENEVPPTGDESRIGLWVMLAAAALCGCASSICVPRKRKTK